MSTRYARMFSCIAVGLLASMAPVLAAPATLTLFHRFGAAGSGFDPAGGLTSDSAGNIYGTTGAGGQFESGTVFKLSPTGTQTDLYSFSAGELDGHYPSGGVVFDKTGNIYGVTEGGGYKQSGVVYKLSLDGTETTVYAFQGGSDGADPVGPPALDAAGNIYGTTTAGGSLGYGEVYKITPDGTKTSLHDFASTDGVVSAIVYHNGLFYGSTQSGGASNDGTIYSITKTGVLTVLHAFSLSEVISPNGGMLSFDKFGNIFGTANGGLGAVFKLTPGGTVTVLYYFNGMLDGFDPRGNVIFDKSGNLYTTTTEGGRHKGGTIFEETPGGKEKSLAFEYQVDPFGKSIVINNTLYVLGQGGQGSVYTLQLPH